MEQAVARKVWLEAIEKIKDVTIQPSLWRALEVSQGIAIDGDVFVIGFTPADYPESGLLRSSEHRSVIEKVLARVTGNPQMRFRTIEGTTMADYETVKRREAIVEAQRAVVAEKKSAETATQRSWDDVFEGVSRLYAGTQLRQLPQIRAKFLQEALKMVSDAMDTHYTDDRSDVTERALARVIDRIAALIEAPSVWVATKLMRMREGR